MKKKGGKIFTFLLFMLFLILLLFIIFKIQSITLNKETLISEKDYMQGIDMIYWINLDRSPDRRKTMDTMFTERIFTDVPNTRFSAIDGKSVDVFSFLDSSQKEEPQLNNVEYACLLSHLEVIRTFSESNHKVALIMEDDMTLEFRPYWKKRVGEIIQNAPADWEVIQLCYIGEIPENEYQPWFYHFSAGAYLINQKGAQKLMQIRENNVYDLKKHPNPPYLHADSFIFSYLNTYCYKYPMFIYKDENDSLLHDEHIDSHIESKRKIVQMYQSM
jgi:GR25 family glycosyltransferase involved in LPS biosynthesis